METNTETRVARTDCHSPANIVPADYEYVAQDCVKIEGLGDCYYAKEQREIIRRHMARTGGTYSRHRHGGNCGVCGSVNAVYTVLFYHAKTNTYVRTGQECAQLIDARAAEGVTRMRDAVRDAREFQKGKAKAKAILADAGLAAAWDIFANTSAPNPPADYSEMTPAQIREHRAAVAADRDAATIRDIVGKLVKYGSVSEKALGFVRSLLDLIARAPVIEAAREAEQAAAAPCPEGRVEVTGEILSVRVDEGPYGDVTKMLVRAAQGFKVWCSMPAHANASKGDKITFKAQLTPSDTDPKFGFGKRPKLIAIEHAQAEAQAQAAAD